ncbi:type 1 fimbrial protein [Serratia marcescens]|jgi:type 1 fimbria pilin|uniref:fimbrial protein n=1 Tax=Serratia marcescens TaxID=615 RepID=UPI0011E75DFD|nr:fimbrial protein [Serratia marcescens]MBH2879021.1 type 1 fimbrial protein [Serratia marcescens]
MKLNKIMMAAVLAFGVTSVAHAADQGHGTVTFKGSIIDAPCSIVPESDDQVVQLGQISNAALKGGKKSTPKSFQIKLEDCELDSAKANTVKITFTGTASADDAKLLELTGTAKGAAIAITDSSGALLELGKAADARALNTGNNSLGFTAYLQGSKASGAVITPGEFQSVADFTLAYQ